MLYKYFGAGGPPRRRLRVIASLVTIDHIPGLPSQSHGPK